MTTEAIDLNDRLAGRLAINDVAAFNQLRAEYPDWRPFLRVPCLGKMLATIDLSGADLEGVNFSHADLLMAHFAGASLVGARFEGAQLLDVSFLNANLKGANFREADCCGAIFSGAFLHQTDLRGIKTDSRTIGLPIVTQF